MLYKGWGQLILTVLFPDSTAYGRAADQGREKMNEWRITYWDATQEKTIRLYQEDDPSGRGEYATLETISELIRGRNIGITIGYYTPDEKKPE
jgi:hypothetical protein